MDLPDRMKKLSVDDRGYVVPWFVAYVDGRPEFRALDPAKWRQAVKERRCWVCGEPLGRWLAFPVGSMCTITRTISEPPSHRECAEWSVKHCPFLSQPNMVRRTEGLPDDMHFSGIGLKRNPGVVALWITRTFETFPVGLMGGDRLITMGRPESVTWWCEGQPATRDQVEASIADALPALLTAAQRDGPFAVEALGKMLKASEQLWPAS
jgi:hypothetical protein